MSKQSYKKLQSRTLEPFRIIIIQEKLLAIDELGIPQTVPTDQVTHVSEPTRTNLKLPSDSLNKQNQSIEQLHNEILLEENSNHRYTPQNQEFLVDIIVWYIGTGPETKYIARAYGKVREDNTDEPQKRIPKNVDTIS